MAHPVRCVVILAVLVAASPAKAVDFQGLGSFPDAFPLSIGGAISGDGLVVVGNSDSARALSQEAFRWTQAEGMIPLGDIEGGTFASGATDASFDGSVT